MGGSVAFSIPFLLLQKADSVDRCQAIKTDAPNHVVGELRSVALDKMECEKMQDFA